MWILTTFFVFVLLLLAIRIIYIVSTGERFIEKSIETEQRERSVKAPRGRIFDRNGVLLADNSQVCTISVIHNQIEEPEKIISEISGILELPEEKVRKRVEKHSSIEIIKTNVPYEKGEEIRKLSLAGVKVDTDYRRTYIYPEIMSRLIGFTGSDNQGVVGLETVYDDLLTGVNGTIYTYTDVTGDELSFLGEVKKDQIPGDDLYLTIDYNIQKSINSIAKDTRIATSGKTVSIIVMNPSNGEILGMTTDPEYNNMTPFVYYDGSEAHSMEELNEMWRNPLVSDSYEPGSTFKVITTTSALCEGTESLSSGFFCSGVKLVGDRKIHCHKLTGHGSVSFEEALSKSCNVALMDIGLKLGAENLYNYMKLFGLKEKTGIDLPGEAGSIMHKLENVGEVELATMSFGQSFQITPIQLLRAFSCCINGGNLITPHVGLAEINNDNKISSVRELEYEVKSGVIDENISETMQGILQVVVDEGTGKNAAVPGYAIGGKTATSEKLPRSSNKYIASFVGFAPADNPEVMVLVLIDEPQGVYYGGTIAAPVAARVFENILPYLNIEKNN